MESKSILTEEPAATSTAFGAGLHRIINSRLPGPVLAVGVAAAEPDPPIEKIAVEIGLNGTLVILNSAGERPSKNAPLFGLCRNLQCPRSSRLEVLHCSGNLRDLVAEIRQTSLFLNLIIFSNSDEFIKALKPLVKFYGSPKTGMPDILIPNQTPECLFHAGWHHQQDYETLFISPDDDGYARAMPGHVCIMGDSIYFFGR